MVGRSSFLFAAAALAGLGLASAAAGTGGEPRSAPRVEASSGVANRCLSLATPDGRFVVVRGDQGYGADAASETDADAFHLKPTGLGTHLIQDRDRALMAAGEQGAIVRAQAPTPAAEWAVSDLGRRGLILFNPATSRFAVVDPATGALALAAAEVPPRFVTAERRRCARYPEAKVGARGTPGDTTNRDGGVFGIADAHMHVTANLRAGGMVISGEPFHPYGVPEALGRDAEVHGSDGSLDATGSLLRGDPGSHDTNGWSSFSGWPVHDTYTHQQAYYVWVERMWKAGLRFLVAQAVEDTALCELQPRRSHSCDETETVKLAIAELRELEAYIDAQAGGPGRGWFRLVTTPRQARRVIAEGKLAVIIGMETSSPLGCEEFQGEPQCSREDIDRVLGELHELGVRSIFIAHWTDNAYSGAALQSGEQGAFIGLFQQMTTGHPFATQPCGEADEAEGTCNAKGFTEEGRYLLERLIERRMLIEADHLSQAARATVLEIAEANDYPLVSSHTYTGGEWTREQLRRLYALGGVATATPETAPEWAQKINAIRAQAGAGSRGAVALGSDTGGFAALPGPREGADLAYPFSLNGVRFKRQRTGERTYDLNADGVAHYGLFADLIADTAGEPGGRAALRSLYRSAEAYLRMWERTYE